VPDISDENLLSLEQQKAEKIEIELTVTKSKQMNVYLYGGPSRYQATKSILPGNAEVEVGQVYKVDYRIGFLLVAYPNEGMTTDFEFTY